MQLQTTHFRKTLLIYTLLIFVMAVITINSYEKSLNNTYVLSFRLDYLIHFVVFIPWMWLVWKAYDVNFRKDLLQAITWIFLGLIFAGLTEGIQYFIPYRAFNINDLLANSIGVLLGALLFIFPNSRIERKVI
ncbi:MAG: VanZ family protein [Tenuifilaceae bacterium]